MGTIVINLNEVMKKLYVTKNAVSRESKVRYATVYTLANNEAKAINLDTMAMLLDGLNDIAKKQKLPPITIADVLEYHSDAQD